MATLSTGGLGKFRKWYTQYKAIHGTEPPQDLMESALSAEMEADMASQDRSRQISLQQRGVELNEKEFAQRQAEYAQTLKMNKEKMKNEEQAAMVSGIKDIAGLGLEAKRTFSPSTTSPSYSSGISGISAARSTPSVAPYSSYGTDSFGQGTDTAIDLSRYSGYGTDAGVSYDAGTPALSQSGGTSGGGINMSGLGTNLAIAAANRYITPALAEKASERNVEAGKSLSVAGGALEGFTAGRSFGPAGMVAGTILGTERAGWRQDNQGGEIFDKDYNKGAGFASMFGITAGQVEQKKDTQSVKIGKAMMTGGVSHIAGKIKSKLKKLF